MVLDSLCQSLDKGLLKELGRAVVIVLVIHTPAVVDTAVLLNLNVVIVCDFCGCHLELSQVFFYNRSFLASTVVLSFLAPQVTRKPVFSLCLIFF